MSKSPLHIWLRPASAEQRHRWYQVALRTAWVAGLLTSITTVLLIYNHHQIGAGKPFESPRMDGLKKQLAEQPDNAALIEEIHELDIRLREQYFHGRALSHAGKQLLAVFLAVFLISGLLAFDLGQKTPEPQDTDETPAIQIARSRQTIVASGLITLALGILCLPLLLERSARFDTRSQTDLASTQAVASWMLPYPALEAWNRNWPCFRGPSGNGVVQTAKFPMHWDGTIGRNIRWKSPVPLPGHGSPVVWEGRVFLSGGTAQRRTVLCYESTTGKLLWKTDVFTESVSQRVMEETGYAAPTPVVDGQRVYAIFVTGELAALDFDGNIIWRKSLGFPDNVYNYAASLAMYRNILLVQFDQGTSRDQESRLYGFDGATGEILWQRPRPVANSWASPIVAYTDNGPQLITCADPWLMVYNPLNGDEIWKADCLGGDVAPSPIYTKGNVFVVEPWSAVRAYRSDGAGDVTESHKMWENRDGVPEISSPVGNDRFLFMLAGNLLTCCRTSDGTMVWEKDFEEDFDASPTLVGDKLYILDNAGSMIVLDAADTYQERAHSPLGELSSCSPAFVNQSIYIRGADHLYCIAENEGQTPDDM